MDDRVTPAAGPSDADKGARNLITRVAAASVLAPVAIALAYAGGIAWSVLATLVAIGLFGEWLMVVGAQRDLRVAGIGAAALALIGVCAAAARFDAAIAVAAVAGAVAALLSASRIWTTTGFCYAAAALIASVLLRRDPAFGFQALMLVLLVVWVSDIGGYLAGRGIGGPKLWPQISPKKTWAGAVGGFVASLAVGVSFSLAALHTPWSLVVLAGGLSVVSQLGDLFESAVKRRFGVKDSSHIIPGHGGLLDRLDGFVAAIVVAAAIGYLRGGTDGAGRGLVVW